MLGLSRWLLVLCRVSILSPLLTGQLLDKRWGVYTMSSRDIVAIWVAVLLRVSGRYLFDQWRYLYSLPSWFNISVSITILLCLSSWTLFDYG